MPPKKLPEQYSDQSLDKIVFHWDSGESDNRFFRQKIVDFVNGAGGYDSFTKYMWGVVWERNDKGKTIKYCHFNEHTQHLSLDKYFREWMIRTIKKVSEVIGTLSDYTQQLNLNEKK